MDKRGDIPYWLAMMVYVLISLVVILIIYGLASGKFNEYLGWLEGII